LQWRPDIALHRIRFFGFLNHSKGEWGGSPLVLTPWQQFIVGSVFGWLRADGTRRFRTVYQEVPRKNGKSTLLAGIGISALVGDKEPGAEVYAAATRRDQARIVFDEARRMVRSSPQLRMRVGIFNLNMSVDLTASKFEPLSADDKTLDGLNPHCVIIDELHKHRSRAVLDVLDTAMGARRQPLLWIITTAGDDTPETVYAQENDYAIRVLERIVHEVDADTHFVYISTIDKGDRWDDPKVWAKANPNWGVSVKPDDMRRQARKSKNSPGALSEFMRTRLNVRTAAAGRFIDMDLWDRNTLCTGLNRAVVHRAEVEERMRGRRFYGALDLSSKVDLSAWVKLFPPEQPDERWSVLARFWMPADTVTIKTDRDQVQYRRWIDEGWIDATAGNVIDQDEIRSTVIEDCRSWEPMAVAFDPWNATQLALNLQNEGLPVVEFIQGIRSYTAPTKEFESMLLREVIDHGSNPVMRWMAGNLSVQRDKNENMMPTKQHSRGRIDGMSALIMTVGRALLADQLGDPTGFLRNPVSL
jgi:phage terminase large subunit-like protein